MCCASKITPSNAALHRMKTKNLTSAKEVGMPATSVIKRDSHCQLCNMRPAETTHECRTSVTRLRVQWVPRSPAQSQAMGLQLGTDAFPRTGTLATEADLCDEGDGRNGALDVQHNCCRQLCRLCALGGPLVAIGCRRTRYITLGMRCHGTHHSRRRGWTHAALP